MHTLDEEPVVRECLMRAAYHPVGLPTRQHVERRCRDCGAEGCVVPRCPRHGFTPRQPDIGWRELAIGEGASGLWRCAACRGVRTSVA